MGKECEAIAAGYCFGRGDSIIALASGSLRLVLLETVGRAAVARTWVIFFDIDLNQVVFAGLFE